MSYNLLIKFTKLDLALPVPPIIPIVSPDLILTLIFSSIGFSLLLLYLNVTFLNSILPSGTSKSGSSGFVMSGFSFNTSAIRFALAIDIVIITNTIDNIIRLIRMFIQ